MKQVSIIHPFTPKAAGVVEASVATYHSQPHLKALKFLSEKDGAVCSMEYFTPKRKGYSFLENQVTYTFYPVDFTWNGDHKKWKKQSSRTCLRAYKKNTPDVTIINMSGHSSKFSFQLSRAILKKGKKYIAMLGGQHYTDNAMFKQYYSEADHILVHTKLQKEAMQQLPMFRGLDIRVFPLGVDCELFTPKESVSTNKAPKLLYVGRIVEWKRVHMALLALHKLVENGFPDATLKIIGPVSSESYFTKLKEMTQDLELEKAVTFLGHKEHSELPAYFQDANLFTLPSDKETFGMVMVEAMACGTPVAGINCPGGPADVIKHLENGILTTPEAYADQILAYFKNPDQITKIEQAARQKAVDDYSIEESYRVLKQSVIPTS